MILIITSTKLLFISWMFKEERHIYPLNKYGLQFDQSFLNVVNMFYWFDAFVWSSNKSKKTLKMDDNDCPSRHTRFWMYGWEGINQTETFELWKASIIITWFCWSSQFLSLELKTCWELIEGQHIKVSLSTK